MSKRHEPNEEAQQTDKHLELARDIAAPVWEFRALDPDGFDKWIKTIATRLALFEKETDPKTKGE